jgi:hypothetical protein
VAYAARWSLPNPACLLTGLFLAHFLAAGIVPARAESVIGLTTANSLVAFDSATPGAISAAIPITGIGAETIFDIDRRPENGLLYGFGSAGNLYLVDPITGAATLNAALTGVDLDPGGTRFSIDFNPTVDRLRIISNTGQNLRLTPGTGTTSVDGPLNGASTGAVSVAYTNNIGTATTTVLFYIGPTTPNSLFKHVQPEHRRAGLGGRFGGGQHSGCRIRHFGTLGDRLRDTVAADRQRFEPLHDQPDHWRRQPGRYDR